jgi:hypothetical protein
MDGGTADFVPLELGISHVREFGNHAGTHDVKRTMVLGCPEADEGMTFVLENWVVSGAAALIILRSLSSATRISSGTILR